MYPRKIPYPVEPDTAPATELIRRLQGKDRVPAHIWKGLLLIFLKRLARFRRLDRPESLAQLCAAEAHQIARTVCGSENLQHEFWETALQQAGRRQVGPGKLKAHYDPLFLFIRVRQAYGEVARARKLESLPAVLDGLWQRWNPPCKLTDDEGDHETTLKAALLEELDYAVPGRRLPSAALILVAKAYGLKGGEESLRVLLNRAGYRLAKGQLHPKMAFTVKPATAPKGPRIGKRKTRS